MHIKRLARFLKNCFIRLSVGTMLVVLVMSVTSLTALQTGYAYPAKLAIWEGHFEYPYDKALPRGVVGMELSVTAARVGDAASLVVTGVNPDGPAGKAGIAHGEEVLAIDGTEVKGKNYDELMKMIRGNVGNPVTIKMKGREGVREITLERVSMEQLFGKEKT